MYCKNIQIPDCLHAINDIYSVIEIYICVHGKMADNHIEYGDDPKTEDMYDTIINESNEKITMFKMLMQLYFSWRWSFCTKTG